MQLEARAKLNLALDITGLRADGYHLIDTIMQEVTLSDTLQVELADAIEVDCPGVPYEENTITRAVRLFHEAAGLRGGARVRVDKRIPSGAGLAGGSSDAAATLLALSRLHGHPLTQDALGGVAQRVGADVPFFLYGGTQRALGTGEILERIPVRCAFSYVLAKPEEGVSTREAYRLYDGLPKERVDVGRAATALEAGDAASFFLSAGNVLLPAAERLVPGLSGIGRRFLDLGALHWGLTGSGSCVFGVFLDREARGRALQALRGAYAFVAAADPFPRSSHPGV